MAIVLVIDDDRDVRRLLRRTLEGAGHTVREAADGAEGIRAYRLAPADLVVCDIFMPEKEGLATIGELRREFPDAQVIAVSGGSPDLPVGFLRHARFLGAVAALDKPFTPQQLLEAVGRVLGPG